MPAVALVKLSKQYDDRVSALDDLSLEVAHRELLVVLGPSGCGKTTALRLIAGLEEPTSGEVLIDGQRVTDLPPGDRDVAMVFQNYALYPHMTAAENIAFPLRMRGGAGEGSGARGTRGREGIRRAVQRTAAMVGVEGLLDRRPAQLSGGERQRVALARAIVRNPKVFLFDEPLSNLDAKLRIQMRAELVRLHRRLGATMIHVTHDQVEAMTMGQRIAVLNAGTLQQVGTPGEIYGAPANSFVATFIGTPGMNLVGVGAPERFGGRLVGFRPEDAELGPVEGADFAGVVTLIEPLGSETLVHVPLETGETVVCRLRAEPHPEVDAAVGIRVPPAKLHLFDAVTGRRLP